jgi:hypothetical protein
MSGSNSNNNNNDEVEKYMTPEHGERTAKHWQGRRGTEMWEFMGEKQPAYAPGSSVAATTGSDKDANLKRSENIAQGIFGRKASHPPPETAKKADQQENKSKTALATDKAQSKPQIDSERQNTPTLWKSSNPI